MKRIIITTFICCCCSLIFLFSFQEKSQPTEPPLDVDLNYRALSPGEVIRVRVKGVSSSRFAEIRFLGKKYLMGKGGNTFEFFSIVGIDLGQNQGNYPLVISVVDYDGSVERIEKEISISAKEFPIKKLWVKEEFVTPPSESLERIRRESEILKSVYEIYTPQWLGDGKFIIPSEGEIVPNFGERRIFNNKPRSSHSGVDISTPFGYPVRASNSGKIVLASNLYFAGKSVIIDHGLGVFSQYLHFSKIKANRGDFVEKGSVIGEIGATGRVTGPHLHWGIRVLGSRVDPFSLLILDLE